MASTAYISGGSQGCPVIRLISLLSHVQLTSVRGGIVWPAGEERLGRCWLKIIRNCLTSDKLYSSSRGINLHIKLLLSLLLNLSRLSGAKLIHWVRWYPGLSPTCWRCQHFTWETSDTQTPTSYFPHAMRTMMLLGKWKVSTLRVSVKYKPCNDQARVEICQPTGRLQL